MSVSNRTRAEIEKWRAWLNGRIRDDVLRLHWQRMVFRELDRIRGDNDALPTSRTLDEYVFDTYAAAQVAAVRRVAEHGSGANKVQSLGRLLEQLASGDYRISREWFMSGWPTRWNREDEGNATFDLLAGNGIDEYEPERAADDLARLSTTAEQVIHCANRYVAHTDKRRVDQLPRVSTLDDSIDVITTLYEHYSRLITTAPHAAQSSTSHLARPGWRYFAIRGFRPDDAV